MNIPDLVNCSYFYICKKHFLESDCTNSLQERLKFQTVPKAACEPVNISDFPSNVSDPEASIRSSCSHEDNSPPSVNITEINNTHKTIQSLHTDNVHISSNTCDNLLELSTDHDYCKRDSSNIFTCSVTVDHSDKYSFLLENKSGILNKVGIGRNDLTPQKSEMFRIHRNVQSRLSKLRILLKRERAHLTSVRNRIQR
jgi:hypothetical protein